MAPAVIMDFQKVEILTVCPKGPTCITVPNLTKIGQTVMENWRFNGFQLGGRPPSWIFVMQFRDPFCNSLPNFVKIGQSITEISQFL